MGAVGWEVYDHIDLHPIRMSADAFASWINDELPANDEELRAMLWTFGEILNGEMERQMNSSHQRHMDLLIDAHQRRSSSYHKRKREAFYDSCDAGDVKDDKTSCA